MTPAPEQPKFAFVGLKDGQTAGWPQKLKVSNLPKGTAKVHFYWGTSPWSFAKTYVWSTNQTSVEDEDLWYLYGKRTLTAVAFNAYGRVIGKAKVELKGW